MTSREALDLAYKEGLDLVMVAAQAQPPVCRIVDNGKFKYENSKRARENKKKTQDVKGIKMRPNIAENDMNTLLRHATKFLEEGDKVRVTCQFRVRELAHPEIGRRKMDTFAEKLAEYSVIDKMPTLEGRQMIMVLNPKPGRVVREKSNDMTDSSTKVDSEGNVVLIADGEYEDLQQEGTGDKAAEAPKTGKDGKPEKKKQSRTRHEDLLADLLGE